MVTGEVALLGVAGVGWGALTVSQETPGPVASLGPPMLSEVPVTMGQEWIQRQRAWRQGPSLRPDLVCSVSVMGLSNFFGSIGVTQ